MANISVTVELVPTSCWCGIEVAIPRSLYDEAQRAKQSIYCPIGHTFVYNNTENERLRRQLTQAQDATARAEAQARSLARQLQTRTADAKRAERRAKAGVCPCCHRTFVRMRRHMAAKHPEHVVLEP